VLLVRRLLGDAPLAWVTAAAVLALFGRAEPLLRQGATFYDVSGAAVLLTGALAGGWWLFGKKRVG
jgi:hypothetical protein